MDISKYTAFFHDGSIMNIIHKGDKIEFSMASAEIDEDDMHDSIVLSRDNSIQGKLQLEGVKSIKENGQFYLGFLKMKHLDAEIFHFKINQNKVELQIVWNAYPPKPCIEDFSTLEIEAEKIYWKNIPNLIDSFYPN